MKYIYTLIIIVALAVFMTACSKDVTPSDNVVIGDDTTTNTPKDTTKDNVVPSTNTTLTNTNTTLNTSTTTTTTTSTQTGTPKDTTKDTTTSTTRTLKDLFVSRTLKYTAEYTVDTNDQSDIMTQVYDLPKYVMITKMGAEETRTIFDGSDFIVCSSADDSWQCFKMNVEQSPSAQTEEEVSDGTATTTVIGTCNVASETGTKYEVVASDGGKSQVCYTSDGILLSITTLDPEYYMVATKITRSVDSTLFVPPVEPQDLSNLMANLPQ